MAVVQSDAGRDERDRRDREPRGRRLPVGGRRRRRGRARRASTRARSTSARSGSTPSTTSASTSSATRSPSPTTADTASARTSSEGPPDCHELVVPDARPPPGRRRRGAARTEEAVSPRLLGTDGGAYLSADAGANVGPRRPDPAGAVLPDRPRRLLAVPDLRAGSRTT